MQSSIKSVIGALGWVVIAALAATNAIAEQQVPVLRYDPPANFYRSAITPPDDYASNEFNANVQVYPFRPFSGSIEQMFQKTLLREWIDPRYQEANVAGPPEFRMVSVKGAQVAMTAKFAESIVGTPKPRMRMVIVANGTAAIVDAFANSPTTWQRALPALNALAASLRVEAEAAPPSMTEGSGPAGRAMAGLYMGTKPKYIVNVTGPVGSGTHVPALHFYLFSSDGRVYRAYDEVRSPGGDISRFDFDVARRADPVNSGRYTVTGNQLRIQLGTQPIETIVTTAPQNNRVTINTVVYVRQ